MLSNLVIVHFSVMIHSSFGLFKLWSIPKKVNSGPVGVLKFQFSRLGTNSHLIKSRTWWSLELGATKENPESASSDIPWSLIIYLCVFIIIIGIASFIIWRFLLWRRIELYKLNSVR